ncbi:MAG TPA: helix-turn-helix domain-containing protein [Solirubrobacteraceae bacterium]|jgi:DNA-binding HxlR family transcriptional regulator
MDLLGRRWTLRVLWDLRDGPLRFGDLQADEISTSVLTARLRELEEAGLVERGPDRAYGLTGRGEELKDLLLPLNDFAKRGAGRGRRGGGGAGPGRRRGGGADRSR